MHFWGMLITKVPIFHEHEIYVIDLYYYYYAALWIIAFRKLPVYGY